MLIVTVLEFSALMLYQAVLSCVGVGLSMNSFGGHGQPGPERNGRYAAVLLSCNSCNASLLWTDWMFASSARPRHRQGELRWRARCGDEATYPGKNRTPPGQHLRVFMGVKCRFMLAGCISA